MCLARRLIRVEAAAGSISGLTRGGGRKRRIVDGSTLQHVATRMVCVNRTCARVCTRVPVFLGWESRPCHFAPECRLGSCDSPTSRPLLLTATIVTPWQDRWSEFYKFDLAWHCFKGLKKGSCSYSWRRWPFAGPILRVSSLRHIVVVIRYVGGCRLCQCCVRVSSESNIRA